MDIESNAANGEVGSEYIKNSSTAAFMADVVFKYPAAKQSLVLSAWWATFTLAKKCFTNVVSLGLKNV